MDDHLCDQACERSKRELEALIEATWRRTFGEIQAALLRTYQEPSS